MNKLWILNEAHLCYLSIENLSDVENEFIVPIRGRGSEVQKPVATRLVGTVDPS